MNGLKAEDFQILDNGKPRRIVSFEALPANDAAQPAVFVLLDLFNADLAARGFTENELVQGFGKLASAENVYLYLLTSTGAIYVTVQSLQKSGHGNL